MFLLLLLLLWLPGDSQQNINPNQAAVMLTKRLHFYLCSPVACGIRLIGGTHSLSSMLMSQSLIPNTCKSHLTHLQGYRRCPRSVQRDWTWLHPSVCCTAKLSLRKL